MSHRGRTFVRFARGSLALLAFVTACESPRPAIDARPTLQSSSVVPPAATGDAAPILPESASQVTFERIAKFPEPGWQVPRQLHLSPDGKLVTYLRSEDGSDKMALFARDASGKESVLVRASDLVPEKPISREEELRGERQRRRITGVTDYAWADKANVMVVPLGGDVFVRGVDGAIQRVTETPEPEIDPQLCPTGAAIAYVRGSELYATDLGAKKHERALTHGAKPGITRGQSDFNGQEELDESHGFFWSPDCKHIAYLEVDERAVAEIPVMGYRGKAPDLMMQRYPVAGATNPAVTLQVYDFASSTSRAVTLPEGAVYMGRFKFAPDGTSLFPPRRCRGINRPSRSSRRRRCDRQGDRALEAKSPCRLGRDRRTSRSPETAKRSSRSPTTVGTTISSASTQRQVTRSVGSRRATGT